MDCVNETKLVQHMWSIRYLIHSRSHSYWLRDPIDEIVTEGIRDSNRLTSTLAEMRKWTE